MTSEPVYVDDLVTVWHGDCLDVLRAMPDASVDAVVTDPPYGLEFMQAAWDAPWREQRNPAAAAASPGDEWESSVGAGFSKPGLGDRQTEWPSYGSARASTANPTCSGCGGRMRGAVRCGCEEPTWVVKGRPYDPVSGMYLDGEGEAAAPAAPSSARQWRAFQAWCEEWAVECLRVLKPGGHLLAFGGTRTWHRLACGIEDAGFEVRDGIAWLYGSGFPKSMNVGKAIEAHQTTGGSSRTQARRTAMGEGYERSVTYGMGGTEPSMNAPRSTPPPYRPGTPEAEAWQGWGTALKPAFEPIVVARKPLGGTVAQTVLAHGTGALNIDACRIGTTVETWPATRSYGPGQIQPGGKGETQRTGEAPAGRWPANVVLSHADGCQQVGEAASRVIGAKGVSGFASGYEAGDGAQAREVAAPVWACVDGCPVKELDAQSGASASPATYVRTADAASNLYGAGMGENQAGDTAVNYGDAGGASRFFATFEADSAPFLYTPKANQAERPKVGGEHSIIGLRCQVCGRQQVTAPGSRCDCEEPQFTRGEAVAHPTVKPVAVMRWLLRLVTPPGGVVLDPFAGSGTTGEAAVIEGFRCVLVEREADYVPLIRQRLTKPIQPDLFGAGL